MHIHWLIALAGAIAGFVVGLTGMGGGAIMTPMLVLLFHVDVGTAVASDLVAALIMKPVGGAVHLRKGTVNWDLVKWLVIGSIPTAFAGVFVINSLGNPDQVEARLKIILGVFLLIAATAVVVKAWLQHRRDMHIRSGRIVESAGPLFVRPLPTLIVGAAGGLMVGMTSVGSGSLIIILMMVLYPRLRGRELVGTDLVQAIPLVGAAALAHILYGDFQLGLTASILIGALPGVYFGAKISSTGADGFIRVCLVYVLAASGLRLVNVPTETLFWILIAGAVVGLPIWGAIDAHSRPDHHWVTTDVTKKATVRLQAWGALFGVGFVTALHYFTRTRKKLKAAEASGAAQVPPSSE